MELLDLLETRVAGLLEQIDALREENNTLRETSVGLAELREENRALKESLDQHQRMRDEIDGRIDALLAKIRDYGTSA